MMDLLPAVVTVAIRILMIADDAVNNILRAISDLIVNSADILTDNTDTEKVQPAEESDGNDIGSPGRNSQSCNELVIKRIYGQSQ